MDPKSSKDIEIQLMPVKSGLGSSPKLQPKKQKIFATFYNAEQIPPNFTLAKNHGKANRLYKPKLIEEDLTLDDSSICPCCKLPIEGEPLPLTSGLEVLFKTGSYHMGCGYALYFTFLKYCVGMILLMLLFSGAYNLFSNMILGACGKYYCEGGFATFLSLANKKDDRAVLDAQLYLNLVTILFMMAFCQFFRYKLRKIAVQVEEGVISPSSYTLKVTRLSPNVTDQEIKDWFEALSSARFPIKCVNIVRTYDIKELFSLETKKEELAMDFNNKAGKERQTALREELVEIKEQILNNLHKKESRETSTVFVTFEKPSMVTFLLKMLKPEGMLNFFSRLNPFSEQLLVMHGHNIDIQKAPEPTDVMWENLGYKGIEKIKHRFFTNFCALLVLAAGFGIIIGVSVGRKYIKKNMDNHSDFSLVLSVLGSLFIVAVNIVLSVIIKKLTLSEKHSTKTGFATAVAYKETIALFFNTAFTSFLVEIITTDDLSIQIDPQTLINAVNVYGEGGLIANIFFVFVMDGLYTPLFNIFDPEYYFKLIMQRKALKQGDLAAMTQGSANILFEAPQPNMSVKYSFLIKTMLLTSFYAPALPTAIIITIVVVIMTYWSDKYLFLRRNPLPPALDSFLSTSMMGLLEWMPFMFAIGNIIFMATLVQSNGELAYDDNNRGVILATIFVSLLSIFVPMKLLNSFIFRIKGEAVEDIPYEEAKANFNSDYDTQNPVARHKALDVLPYRF